MKIKRQSLFSCFSLHKEWCGSRPLNTPFFSISLQTFSGRRPWKLELLNNGMDDLRRWWDFHHGRLLKTYLMTICEECLSCRFHASTLGCTCWLLGYLPALRYDNCDFINIKTTWSTKTSDQPKGKTCQLLNSPHQAFLTRVKAWKWSWLSSMSFVVG